MTRGPAQDAERTDNDLEPTGELAWFADMVRGAFWLLVLATLTPLRTLARLWTERDT